MRRTPRLTLTTNAQPVPATFPEDEVIISPWRIEGATIPQMSMLAVNDGKTTIPRLYVLPAQMATDAECLRFRLFVRGEAVPPVRPATTLPRLEP